MKIPKESNTTNPAASKTRIKDSAFENFDQLVKKIVNVPKKEAESQLKTPPKH
jgi:hypothetical protein